MRPVRVFAVGLLLFASCGGGGGGSSSGDAGSDGPTAEDSDAFASGSQARDVDQQSFLLVDSLLHFDPSLSPSATADANAQTIQQNAAAQLGSCGAATVTGTTVTVNFGSPPGCTLANGVTASGVVTVAVSKTASVLTVMLTFTSLVVNGTPIAGTASFATTNGSTFMMSANLTSGDASYQVSLTITGAAGGFTVAGTTQTLATKVTYLAVHYTTGKCYPDGGSLTVTKGRISMTVSFSTQSADTGKVTVTEGQRNYPMTLPAYGNCPVGAIKDAGTADR